MRELVWLQELMQRHPTGLRLVSVSFDRSMADAMKAIRHSVTRDPAVMRLREMGVTAKSGDVRKSMLDALRKHGVAIDPAAENAVLKTVQVMGADLDRVALAEREPLKAAFGPHVDLYLVPKEQQQLFSEAVDDSGLPYLIVIDRKGTLRFAGDPQEDEVSELVDKLVAEAKSDTSAKGNGIPGRDSD